jgi:chromosome segregation ATPase
MPPQAAEAIQIPIEAQIQTTAQAHAQTYAPQQGEFSFHQNSIQPTQTELPAAQSVSFEMVPQQQHEELKEQYVRLGDRFKRLVEERDALSRQVSELRSTLAEYGRTRESQGRDYKEEIRLLGKLIDDEQSLRGTAKPGDELYARHDKLVDVFLNIAARTE